MSLDTAKWRRLVELVDGHIDCALSDAEAKELTSLLEESDNALRYYMEMSAVNCDLRMKMADADARPVKPRRVIGHAVPLAAAAALIVAVGLAWWIAAGGRLARVVEIEGIVLAQGVPLQTGDTIGSGAKLETKNDGKVRLTYIEENTEIELGAGSSLEFHTAARLHLAAGSLTASIAPRPDDPMVITTPHARTVVIGTKLVLAVQEDASRVEVTEGRVQCERVADSAEIEIEAGQYAVAGEDVALVARAIPLRDRPEGLFTNKPLPDGPVILRDDFENGLGNWEGAVFTVPRTGRRAQDGHCIELRPGAGEKAVTLRLRKAPAKAAFSVQCDIVAENGTVPEMSFGGIVEQMMRRDFVDSNGRLPGSWHTMRWEVVCTGQDADTDILEIRGFVAGELWWRTRRAVKDRHVLIISTGKATKIDNVLIRELHCRGSESLKLSR